MNDPTEFIATADRGTVLLPFFARLHPRDHGPPRSGPRRAKAGSAHRQKLQRCASGAMKWRYVRVGLTRSPACSGLGGCGAD